MNKFEFGMKAVQQDGLNGDFKIYDSNLGGNYNPYNSTYFDREENRVVCPDNGRITSIPSPYARMHITDLAFREANSGSANGQPPKALSLDYNIALSHCLDIFEMLFYSDAEDLEEKGVSVEKIDLVRTSTTNVEEKALLNANPKLKAYISTLDLYRNEYVSVLDHIRNDKHVNQYLFDFNSLYLFKYKGKVFASTSPLTGFFAIANCNIGDLAINGNNILSSNPNHIREIGQRTSEFREFMYSLLFHTGLCHIFKNLFIYVKNSLDANQIATIDQNPFQNQKQYLKFNIGGQHLLQVKDNLYIRPGGIDCSYLKYYLYLAPPVDFAITEQDYATKLNERQFNGQLVSWYGVNDILSDALFVLTYDINDNYVSVPYVDINKDCKAYKRCLLPIKRGALDFFTVDELCNGLRIEKRDHSKYVATLKITLLNGGTITLRREYTAGDVCYPNGKVFQGDDMKPFAFGIYPFVKSTQFDNMYKVLFYNHFDTYSLKFYKKDANGINPLLETETKVNKTNNIHNQEFGVNCEYHDINIQTNILEFAEIEVSGLTSLIIPNLRMVGEANDGASIAVDHNTEVTVAIDLGTSNTYVAYSRRPFGGGSISENDIIPISTHHSGNVEWNELTFMNKKCEQADLATAPEKNREDLYLRVSDFDNKPVDTWLSSQLNEFIPSRIDPNGDNYSFPIPTVINFLRRNCGRPQFDPNDQESPLIDFAIPFAYYERGIRTGGSVYDRICNGSDFKWYEKRNDMGTLVKNDVYEAAFKAFLSELMFIVRCHLICSGHDLTLCKIIWSYPLSFSSSLRDEYDRAWKEAYKKYINPKVADNIDDYVKYTNESRSPIYACIKNPGAINHLTVLLDIGGGSTDVIGYKNNNVKFVTSFGFAGNALYLASGMNTVSEGTQMDDTLLKRFVIKQKIFSGIGSNPNSAEMEEKKISTSDSICTLMNYGFAKAEHDFVRIFQNDSAQFMLQLHNAAIIYHVAQLCKIYSPDQLPDTIYLTGNGSKQFELNIAKDSMIRNIFAVVYEDRTINKIGGIKICSNPKPKAATVNGALLGLNQGTLATNRESATNRVVMLGDCAHSYSVDPNVGYAVVDNKDGYKDAVKENVNKFFEYFYDKVYTTASPVRTIEHVKEAIDYVSGDPKLNLPDNGIISDSFFFQYIALVMQELSMDLVEAGYAK